MSIISKFKSYASQKVADYKQSQTFEAKQAKLNQELALAKQQQALAQQRAELQRVRGPSKAQQFFNNLAQKAGTAPRHTVFRESRLQGDKPRYRPAPRVAPRPRYVQQQAQPQQQYVPQQVQVQRPKPRADPFKLQF